MREKIFRLIEPPEKGGGMSNTYTIVMMASIVASIMPLFFKENYKVFGVIDIVTVSLFIIDYVLRWITADMKMQNGKKAFIIYPITPMAVIDLVTILPSFSGMAAGFKLLKVVRLLRMMRIFRLLRYSKNFAIICNVVKKQKNALIAVATMAVGYMVISALVVFNVEPDTFESFFDAFYWACISLTTVGYGDIYPVTVAGQIVTMCSSLVGVAIVALPAGIITAGYMEEIQNNEK